MNPLNPLKPEVLLLARRLGISTGDPTHRKNLGFLYSRREAFPFTTSSPLSAPHPEDIPLTFHWKFLRVPFPHSSLAIWAFETEEGLEKFQKEFGPVPPP